MAADPESIFPRSSSYSSHEGNQEGPLPALVSLIALILIVVLLHLGVLEPEVIGCVATARGVEVIVAIGLGWSLPPPLIPSERAAVIATSSVAWGTAVIGEP